MKKPKFKMSKKLFVTGATAALIVLNEGFGIGLPEETVYTLVGLAATYIFGQAAVDRKLIDNGHKVK
jgi:hypothetical protein